MEEPNLDNLDVILVNPEDVEGANDHRGQGADDLGGAGAPATAAAASGDVAASPSTSSAASPASVTAPGKRPRLSPVWQHFEQTPKPRWVKCKHCDKEVRK